MNPAEEMPSRLEKRFLGLAGGEQAQIRWPPPLPRHQALRLRAAVVSGIHRRFCLRNESMNKSQIKGNWNEIVAAARCGRPELTITLQARCLILAQAVMPNLLARILELVNSLLPKAAPGEGLVKQNGYQSQSAFAPSLLIDP